MTDPTSSRPPSIDRRRRGLLLGLGAMVGSPMIATGAAAADEPHKVTDAPSGDSRQRQAWPFHGEHQQGIVTPRPACGMIAAFSVLAERPEDLEALFRALTARIVFLTQGGTPPALDPRLPPADSGILGPEVAPDNLTITVSVGASLFEDRPWLRRLKPTQLQPMARFPNDALDPALCHGDLALQICANQADTTLHALRDIVRALPDRLVLRWKQEGSVPVIMPSADGRAESARNLLGFRDGSANPNATDTALMQQVVWTDVSRGEPEWAARGTYQAVRIIRNFVERWDRTPLQEQERIFGRRKMSGAPFDGHEESDVPDYARDADGEVTALDAHIRLANPRTAEARRHLILRRPFNYSNGVSKSGQLEQGLLFICYQADLQNGFIAVQNQLNQEPLEEYIRPIGGGYFFVLPGARTPDEYVGSTLISAAGRKTPNPT